MALRRNGNAFTLIELLVVISIIALLIAILLPALQKARKAAEVAECMSSVKQICAAVLMYEQDFGMFPTGAFGASNFSFGWRVNMTAVGNPNNTYWEGLPNCNNGGFGYYVNPYCNIPATNHGNPGTEVFDMFHCPGDQGRFDNPYQPGCPVPAGWPLNNVTAFEWQGTSYVWNGMSLDYGGSNLPEPLDFTTGTGTFVFYNKQALLFRRVDDVKRPARQFLAGDAIRYLNYQQAMASALSDCHDYLFNNHGIEEPSMNLGFIDGHVEFLVGQPMPDHFVNSQYAIPFIN